MAKLTRSMIYIPGNNPGMIQNCPAFGADSVLLDLEDAVALAEKDAARELVCNFLRFMDFGDMVVTVRINAADTPYFETDLAAVVPCKPDAIRIPKCQSAEDVLRADKIMTEVEKAEGIPVGTVKIHAMIETAKGIEQAFQVATASPRVTALTLGGQDLTADLGVRKTKEGDELFYGRTRVITAAKAAGIGAFDTVWADVNDNEGLLEETRRMVGLGFTGKAAIHPGQIDWIHKGFAPDEKELVKARRIVAAAEEAEREGKGVVAVDGKMVDAPVVKRAHHLIELAKSCGMEGA